LVYSSNTGLLEPWNLLLLDEVTVDLDVLARSDLLRFLKEESEQRGATIVYATHIFDGLGGWPTHVAHMVRGKLDVLRSLDESFPELDAAIEERLSSDEKFIHNSPLLIVIERWLRADSDARKAENLASNEGKVYTKWDLLSENMKQYGDKYYNYWR
jgi:CCR4-NOT complex subunit CAF16